MRVSVWSPVDSRRKDVAVHINKQHQPSVWRVHQGYLVCATGTHECTSTSRKLMPGYEYERW